MKKTKDTDFLYATMRIRALERFLLNHEQIERMLEAKSVEDTVKVIVECGYDEFPYDSLPQIENALSRERTRVYMLLRSFVPVREIVDTFQIKYDYHNVKVILKSEAMLVDGSRLLIGAGRFSPSVLTDAIQKSDYLAIPKPMQLAIEEANELLSRTFDPQLSDLVLDRACYDEMLTTASKSGSNYMVNYVRLSIDIANLKIAVRSVRAGKKNEFLRRALIAGGHIEPEKLFSFGSGLSLEKTFYATPLEQAAALGDTLASPSEGAGLSVLDELCDNALSGYLGKARMIPFGEAPIIAYMASKELEYTIVRTILSGRLSNLPSDSIRQRLTALMGTH